MKKILLTLALTPFLLTSVAIAAPILWVGDGAGNLGTVDVNTGNVNVIGNMGRAMTDIAFDSTGNLYGITFSSLYSINTTTGASTSIGSHNLGTGNKNSLVFDAAGNLFAANSSLYTLNTATGASTLIGSGGSSYQSSGDLAFVGGELFLSSSHGPGDTLVKLNTSTGIGTDVGSIGFSNVFGLATPDNGNLYGVSGTGVLTINTASGAGALAVSYSGQGLGTAWGSAFYSEAGAAVPEPSTMLLFGTGIAGLAAVGRKKIK